MSKSECTCTQYRAQWKNQTSLDLFGFKKHGIPASNLHSKVVASGGALSSHQMSSNRDCHGNDEHETSLPIIPQAQTTCEVADESTALESEETDVLLTEGPSDLVICLDVHFGQDMLEPGECGEAAIDDEAAEG